MIVLFWNTHNNEDINNVLAELIIENDVDIVILAEYKANSEKLIETLSKQKIRIYPYITAGCNRIKILGKMSVVEPAFQSDYASMQIINRKYILCGVHLPSQIYTNNEGMRNIEISKIVLEIEKLEEKLKIKNTIIVGDLNIVIHLTTGV